MAEEILPNLLDIGNRHITRDELTRFRGREKQVVCISDDKNRLAITYGDAVNHYEETVLFSDLSNGLLEACIKVLKSKYKSDTITSDNYTVDTNNFSIFDLSLRQSASLVLLDSKTYNAEGREITVFITALTKGAVPSFDSNIRWVGSLPVFPTDVGSKYKLKFYFTSSGIIGEFIAPMDFTEPEEDPLSEDDKQLISDIAHNLDDIRSIAESLAKLKTLENNLDSLNTLYTNTNQLLNLARSITTLQDLSSSLTPVLEVQKYLTQINLLAHHLQDKYFLDVKVTTQKIDGNTILPLDKIVLAPSEYVPVSSVSGLDTDSSDGTISPQLLVWSDEDIDNTNVGDGTIVVFPTRNKIDSLN